MEYPPQMLENEYEIELERQSTGERPTSVRFPMGIIMEKPGDMEEIEAVKKIAAVCLYRHYDEKPKPGDRMMLGEQVLVEFDEEIIESLKTCDLESYEADDDEVYH